MPDRNGFSKLLEKEREWAITFGHEQGIEILQAFIAGREQISAAARRILQRCDEMKAEKNEKKNQALDAVQKAINFQLGVSDEVFSRDYH